MGASRLPVKNLIRRPGRTAALVLLTAFLALSVFGGSVVVRSLQSGLDSLQARLGADIVVLPGSARSKVDFQQLLLQGTAGAFYMDADALEKVNEVEGVAHAAPQTFLASLKADCCAVKVQVIGIDPEADFTVRPWIEKSYARTLSDMDLAVGCKVTANVGESLKIYDQNCHVVAKLAETGTGLDTAVYCDMATMKKLLAAAEAKGVSHKLESGNSDVISAIYVKVKNGYDIDQVMAKLNSHVRKTAAVRARSLFTGAADSLAGISRTVALLAGAVWVLAFVILLIAFAMMIAERRREFAVLRLLGTSQRGLSGLILAETALCSLAGSVLGVGVAAMLIFPFTALIESKLNLPYLTPGAGTILALAIATVAVTVLIGALASLYAARRLSRTDPGTTLREGA